WARCTFTSSVLRYAIRMGRASLNRVLFRGSTGRVGGLLGLASRPSVLLSGTRREKRHGRSRKTCLMPGAPATLHPPHSCSQSPGRASRPGLPGRYVDGPVISDLATIGLGGPDACRGPGGRRRVVSAPGRPAGVAGPQDAPGLPGGAALGANAGRV